MLPEPPDWAREFSETPRSKFCGISLISRSVVTAGDDSIESRPSEITVDPTGAAPRTRLPVTTISLVGAMLSGTSCGAGSDAACAQAISGTTAMSTDAPASNRARRRLDLRQVPLARVRAGHGGPQAGACRHGARERRHGDRHGRLLARLEAEDVGGSPGVPWQAERVVRGLRQLAVRKLEPAERN